MNSTMWKLETLNRDLRIQGSQGAYWMKQGFGVWIMCSVLVLAIGLSWTDERKENVPKWVVSSGIGAWKPTKTIMWKGNPYDAKELADWMTEHIYHGTLLQWLVWAGMLGVIPVSIGGSALVWWARKPEETEKHVRGAEVISQKALQDRLGQQGKGGLIVGGVQLPEELECHHTAICGATGAGKSNALRKVLLQIEKRGGPCIVVDPHGEATSQFYNPDREDYILNPIDFRCPTWTPQLEGESHEEVAALGAALFRVVPGATGPGTYYATVARRGYRQLMEKAGGRAVHEIPDLLTELVQSKRLRLDRPEVMSTMQNGLDSWRYLRPGDREWSSKKWVENPGNSWLFLTFRDKEKAAVLPIVSLWFALLVSQLLSRDAERAVKIPVVIDELAALEHQPALDDLLSQIRKRRVSVFLGFQDINQLYPLYGEHLTHSMLNQPATQLYFRSNGSKTQQWCAENIGEKEAVTMRESDTVGPENLRDAATRTPQERTKPVVMATQFGQLLDLEAYQKVGPFGITKVKMDYEPAVVNHPPFIPREKENAKASENNCGEGKSEGGEKGGGSAIRVDLSSRRRAL